MAIDAVQQTLREIPAASAVLQISMSRRERESQIEEGQPPMEVASAEQEALCWRREGTPEEKRRKRLAREAQRRPSQGESVDAEAYSESELEASAEDTLVDGREIDPPEACAGQPEVTAEGEESFEDEVNGTLFDSRS